MANQTTHPQLPRAPRLQPFTDLSLPVLLPPLLHRRSPRGSGGPPSPLPLVTATLSSLHNNSHNTGASKANPSSRQLSSCNVSPTSTALLAVVTTTAKTEQGSRGRGRERGRESSTLLFKTPFYFTVSQRRRGGRRAGSPGVDPSARTVSTGSTSSDSTTESERSSSSSSPSFGAATHWSSPSPPVSPTTSGFTMCVRTTTRSQSSTTHATITTSHNNDPVNTMGFPFGRALASSSRRGRDLGSGSASSKPKAQSSPSLQSRPLDQPSPPHAIFDAHPGQRIDFGPSSAALPAPPPPPPRPSFPPSYASSYEATTYEEQRYEPSEHKASATSITRSRDSRGTAVIHDEYHDFLFSTAPQERHSNLFSGERSTTMLRRRVLSSWQDSPPTCPSKATQHSAQPPNSRESTPPRLENIDYKARKLAERARVAKEGRWQPVASFSVRRVSAPPPPPPPPPHVAATASITSTDNDNSNKASSTGSQRSKRGSAEDFVGKVRASFEQRRGRSEEVGREKGKEGWFLGEGDGGVLDSGVTQKEEE